ncbi:hypothetical protein LTR53_008919 [Teratosphaeriaceae sp. CCFEE 6253]|nr:hypothetical protein LTR53_008919 [Teratosphaeriaceae sp. CCFEE 6253]
MKVNNGARRLPDGPAPHSWSETGRLWLIDALERPPWVINEHHPFSASPTTQCGSALKTIDMDDPEIVTYCQYCPPGVRDIIANGTNTFVGEVDDFTVLKYPAQPGGDLRLLEHEYRVFKLVGPHPHIIAVKEFTEQGLYLERARNGTLYHYLAEGDHTVTLQRRVAWSRHLMEALRHLHKHDIVHTDLNPSNVLLNQDLDIKLADLQCNRLSDQGETIWYGERGEPCRYYCPRANDTLADVKTDIFALGSTIHFIMLGHEVYPDIVDGEEGWHEAITSRFEREEFPTEPHACAAITVKCWRREYSCVDEVIDDITAIERGMQRAAATSGKL